MLGKGAYEREKEREMERMGERMKGGQGERGRE